MAAVESNLRVLIADDHMLSRSVISGVLYGKNIVHVDTANDGGKAREMIDRAHALGKPYHLVFLDWEMPVMPGIEVLSFFRHQADFANTAFIMVTAVSAQSQVLEAIKTGVTAYVTKPVSQAAIAKKFDEILLWLKQRHPELS